MIDKFTHFVESTVVWWHSVIRVMIGEPQVITFLLVASAIALFFTLRWELVHWGHMWSGEAVLEIFFSGFVGLMVTIAFYFVPVIVLLALGCGILILLMTAFEKLVAFSVRD